MKLIDDKLRCDICGNASARFEKWTPFSMPPSKNRFTNLPDGHFPGITRANDPKKTVLTMHSCPGCEPKIKRAIKTGNFLVHLPDGPLKKALRSILTIKMLSNLRPQ
jgi:hypothetical protein